MGMNAKVDTLLTKFLVASLSDFLSMYKNYWMIFLTVCIAGLVIGISIPAVSANTEQKIFTNSIGMEFVLIPAGEFDMGSPANEAGRGEDEGPVHRVKISNAFYMSKYEVTQKQWREVMGNNPSSFKGDNLPVEQVSWDDIQKFIKKLNEKESTDKYRLPSEAEWEYAARAGTTTRYSFGDDESKLSEYAWYDNNSGGKTHEVGQKKPNPWGLYDIHGNVHEWVLDIYHKNYNGAPTDGSAWEGDGSVRVVRGGSWGNRAGSSRSAGRHDEDPGVSYVNLGFRLVSDSPPTISEMYTSQNTALQPKIVIDGDPQDWTGIEPIMTDPEGDSTKNVQGSDLKSLYAFKDNNFLYLMVEVYDNPNATKERVQYVFEITENVNSPILKWDYEIGSDAQGNTWLWNLTEYDTRANNENPNPYGLTRRVPGIEAVGKSVFEMKAPLSIIGDPENMIIRARTMLPDDRKFYDDMPGAKFVTNPSLLIYEKQTATPTPLEPSTIPSPSKPEQNWMLIGGIILTLFILISSIVFSQKENNRISYILAGLSSYALLDLVSGIFKLSLLVPIGISIGGPDMFIVIGGLAASVFGILSKDRGMTVSLTVIGFASNIAGFAIFWIIVGGGPNYANPIFLPAFIIWGSIHGIGLGSIHSNFGKTIIMAVIGAVGALLALALSDMSSMAFGVPPPLYGRPPFGYGIFGGIFGIVIGEGMHYVSLKKNETPAKPEIKPELESKPASPQDFVPAPTTPKTFPTELQPKYTDIEFLGKGGFARVFKAKRKSDGETVAVKIPISLDEATGKSFLKEIKAWEEMKHPNIVEMYDMNIMPMPYFEMEFVENKSLEELKKPVEVEDAAKIVFDIAEGLKYAHSRGIIHRDLKPHNVLLTKDMLPKITDWGLSKVLAESKTTSMAAFTPIYAAPEQISPKQFGKADAATDMYQLGVIFYELVTGKLPFSGESIPELSNAIVKDKPVPPISLNPEAKDVNDIILKCLRKKKEKRYQHAEELQEELAEYLKLEYKESLKESLRKKDITRSRLFCADLVLISAKLGDYTEVRKYLSVLKDYAKDEEKTDIENLMNELDYRLKEGIPPGEDFADKVKLLAYRVQMT
jgi:formylglycine-generating enzyme required for sulfatase activity/serine/threonine protein kinase